MSAAQRVSSERLGGEVGRRVNTSTTRKGSLVEVLLRSHPAHNRPLIDSRIETVRECGI